MNMLARNICYVYVLLWMVYQLQGTFLIHGIIAQTIFVLLMLISFYAFVNLNIRYNSNLYVKWLNVMLVVLSVYGLEPIIGGYSFQKWGYANKTIGGYIYLQELYRSIMPIYAFYFMTLKGYVSQKHMKYIFAIFLCCSVLLFYQNYFSAYERTGREEITNNLGYVFVPLIPLLNIVKVKDALKYVCLAVIIVFIIMSMKRGAILVGLIMLLLYIYHHLKTVSFKYFVYILSLSSVVAMFIYKYSLNLYVTSDYFQKRMAQTLEGSTSGRDRIVSQYVDYYLSKSSVWEFFFGHGANGTLGLFNEYAHNDWIEFAINQGMLGVLMYMIYWLVFVVECRQYRGEKNVKYTLCDIGVAYFLITFFSMSFNNMPIAASFCIGYCMAMKQRNVYDELLKNIRIKSCK